MMRSVLISMITLASLESAWACTSQEDVAERLSEVQVAYVEKFASLTPEDFETWSAALKRYGKELADDDFEGACHALNQASEDMNLEG